MFFNVFLRCVFNNLARMSLSPAHWHKTGCGGGARRMALVKTLCRVKTRIGNVFLIKCVQRLVWLGVTYHNLYDSSVLLQYNTVISVYFTMLPQNKEFIELLTECNIVKLIRPFCPPSYLFQWLEDLKILSLCLFVYMITIQFVLNIIDITQLIY